MTVAHALCFSNKYSTKEYMPVPCMVQASWNTPVQCMLYYSSCVHQRHHLVFMQPFSLGHLQTSMTSDPTSGALKGGYFVVDEFESGPMLICVFNVHHDIGPTGRSIVKPAVQLLQIQEMHPVAHSSACNFFICYSYLFYLGHLSLLRLQTRTRRQRNSSIFCSFKSYNPETFMSSTVIASVYATCKRSHKVPCAESGIF